MSTRPCDCRFMSTWHWLDFSCYPHGPQTHVCLTGFRSCRCLTSCLRSRVLPDFILWGHRHRTYHSPKGTPILTLGLTFSHGKANSSFSVSGSFFCLFCFFWFFFLRFRATPVAYGGSQARGQIRDTAASLHHSHSNAGSKPHLRPTPQLTATWDP